MNDDPLERMLKDDLPADEGFTDRVIARLPAPRRRVPRTLLLGGAATLGTVVAILSPSSGRITAMLRTAASASLSTTAPTMLLLACVVVVLVGSAHVAANE